MDYLKRPKEKEIFINPCALTECDDRSFGNDGIHESNFYSYCVSQLRIISQIKYK